MKAILEYDLNDLDDSRSHLRAVKSLDMALVIFDIETKLRKTLEDKIDHESINKRDFSKQDLIEFTMEYINCLFKENGIFVDELIS